LIKIIKILSKKYHFLLKLHPLKNTYNFALRWFIDWSEKEQPSDESGAAGAQNEMWTYPFSHVMSGWKELWCPPVFTTVR